MTMQYQKRMKTLGQSGLLKFAKDFAKATEETITITLFFIAFEMALSEGI